MIASLVASVAVLAAIVVQSPSAARAATAATPLSTPVRQVQRFERLTFRGTTTPAKLSEVRTAAVSVSGLQVQRQQRGYRAVDVHPAAQLRSTAFAAPAVAVPAAAGRQVAAPDFGVGFFGFNGISHYDQRTAGTGAYTNTQFSLEPPDQALCAGNGFAVEAVNNAVAVYNTIGTRLTAPTALSQFFGLAPEINRTTHVYGQFISDPKCYFDRDTQRWFLTELEEDSDAATGAPTGHTATLIAVSQTSDPTAGYNLFSFDTTDARNPGCPCLGDQPLIGADANGFYVSTNEFPLFGIGFNGAQVYALSKHALAIGHASTLVHIDAGALPSPAGPNAPWYSIQPAETPDTSTANGTQNGTEFFMSSLDFNSAGDNRIAVWSLTNTKSLNTASPYVVLRNVVIKSTAYATPMAATQRPGSTPLGSSLGEPLELLQTNDDRMNQVVYAAGRLWSGVNTRLKAGNTGIAFFVAEPGFNGAGGLTAHVVQQGYVSVAGQNVIFPSIGVNSSGRAVLAATLVGPQYYPSAVYVTQDGLIHIAGPGAGPDDGFTAYAAYGGNGAARWGDYSAAVADLDGSIWFAATYIPGGPRTLLANWGTFVGHVQVQQ